MPFRAGDHAIVWDGQSDLGPALAQFAAFAFTIALPAWVAVGIDTPTGPSIRTQGEQVGNSQGDDGCCVLAMHHAAREHVLPVITAVNDPLCIC